MTKVFSKVGNKILINLKKNYNCVYYKEIETILLSKTID
jgi:hypothetical protein